MALTPTPNSGQTLNSSRTQISGNFASIDDAFKIDHVEYNLTGQGLHKRVFFVQQSSDVLTPAATDAALYTKAGTGGPTSLFFRPASNATPVEMSYALKATQGYTILPSGIYIQWASGNFAVNAHDISVGLAKTFPNAVLSMQVTPTKVVSSNHELDWILNAVATTTSTITVSRSTAHTSQAVPFNLLVIGY
jgi:hypothetical protein